MAKTKRSYILITCFLSGAAAIISMGSLATQEWVTARARSITGEHSPSDDFVRIGLFGGVFLQVTHEQVAIPLEMTCSFKLNICAALCGSNLDRNLERIYRNKEVSDQDLETCYGQNIDNRRPILSGDNYDKSYINAGAWLCTIIFLIISIVVGFFSAVLAVYNTTSNPSEKCFNIVGLYVYNGIAFCSILVAIIIWGVMFNMSLTKNVPTYQTIIQEFSTKDEARLGYSYWINLVSLTFYLLNLCLLYIRSYLISLIPEKNLEQGDTANPLMNLQSIH